MDVGYTDHPNRFLAGEVIGIDLLRVKCPANYKKVIAGNAQDIGKLFKPQTFDTVVASEFIEHLENPTQFLKATHKILRDTGRLIISTPNPYYFPTIIANALFLRPEYTAHNKLHDPYHINLFTYRVMITLLEHCDFRLIEVFNANGLVFNLDKGPIIPFPQAFARVLLIWPKKLEARKRIRFILPLQPVWLFFA